MHRRRLLGLSLGAATVGSRGTAIVIFDAPDGMPATRATDLVPRVGAWNGPVVVTDRTTVGAESYGTVDQQMSVLDLDPIGRYALVGEYRLIPGSNYDASTDWKTASLTVGHDWHAGSLVSHRRDVIPVEGKGAGGNLSLRTSQDDAEYRGRLSFDPGTANSRTYRFATVIDRADPPDAGDPIVEATFGSGFTAGWLGGSERDVASSRLRAQNSERSR